MTGFYWSLTPRRYEEKERRGSSCVVFLLPSPPRVVHDLALWTPLPSTCHLEASCCVPLSLTPLCCVPGQGRLTTPGKFYWASWGPAGTAQGSPPGWGRRRGSSPVWLGTGARAPETRKGGS